MKCLLVCLSVCLYRPLAWAEEPETGTKAPKQTENLLAGGQHE